MILEPGTTGAEEFRSRQILHFSVQRWLVDGVRRVLDRLLADKNSRRSAGNLFRRTKEKGPLMDLPCGISTLSCDVFNYFSPILNWFIQLPFSKNVTFTEILVYRVLLALVSFLYRNIGFNTFLGYTIFFFTHRTTSFKELFVHFLHRTIRFKDGLTAENFNKNTQLD